MPVSQITRQRVIARDTCILGRTGNEQVKSMVFDATSLSADANGFFVIPKFSFVTPAVATDPTKIKVYQGLGTNVNAVQTLTETGAPTAGTFTLTFNGATTAPIAYNAASTAVQAALVALSTVGAGNVTVTGGPLSSSALTVTFGGLLGNQPVPTLVVNASLTGGTSPAITAAVTTTGQTAEKIVGVFDNMVGDLFGNAVADDQPFGIYYHATAFDTNKLANWMSFGAVAKAALTSCTFIP